MAEGSLVLRMPRPSLTALSDIRLGMRRTRKPCTKLSLRYYAIEKRNKRNGVIWFLHVQEEDYKVWYRSTEAIAGMNPYGVHLSNKKWPLKKVLI